MKRLLRVLVGLALAFTAFEASAAGSLTVTSADVGGQVTRYVLSWTSSAGGAVSGNTLSIKRGRIFQVELVPGATTPTDLYDVVLNNPRSVDFLVAGGANLSNATTKMLTIAPSIYYDGVGTLDLVVSNAGNAKTGSVILLVGP